METRSVDQIKIYKLILNDMRSDKIESAGIVALSTEKKRLQDLLLNNQKEWIDENWHKSYKKGSILEWYNPPFDGYRNQGIQEEWIDEKTFKNLKNYNYPII